MAGVQWSDGKMYGGTEAKNSMLHDSKDTRLIHGHSNPDIDKTKTPNNFSYRGLTYKEKCARYKNADLSEPADDYVMPDNDETLYAAWTIVDFSLANPSFLWEERDGEIIVTGLRNNTDRLAIPEVLNGLPVTAIEEGAFAGCTTLTYVALPGSIKTVCESAFMNCSSLSEISLAEGIQVIDAKAFESCVSLYEIELPESLKRIESKALAETGLTSLTLKTNFVYLASDALDGCDNLSEIEVSEGNTCYSATDGVLYDILDDVLVKYPPAHPGESYTVSEGTYGIGSHAFRNAKLLSSVVLPDTIWSLGDDAFSGCSGLVELPNLENERLYAISSRCFAGCDGLSEISIPANIQTIGKLAFSSCRQLSQATIPDNVAQIGTMAFNTPDMTIYGNSDSEAQRYALANNILFVTPDTILPESIALNKTMLAMKRGEVALLTATLTPENSTVTDIEWHSDNPEIVDVISDGRVYAISGGITTIYAVASNSLTACCVVSVDTSIDVEEVRIGTGDKTLEVGDNFQLTASVLPRNATDQSLTYTSSNEEVVTVDDMNIITAVGIGTALITVKASSGIDAVCKVHVIRYPESISIDPTNVTAVEGDSVQLEASFEPSDVTERVLAWSSSGENVATVDQNGLLTCKQQGTATITAETLNGLTADCTITVDHDWGEPFYTWATDNSTVTAIRLCTHSDCPGKETETVETTPEITEARCGVDGKIIYTSASFENGSFTVQTKVVITPALSHLWSEVSYDWSSDNSSVTATRYCMRNGCVVTETETAQVTYTLETAPTETEMGTTAFKAAFTNDAFDTQQKMETDIPALKDMSVLRLPTSLNTIEEEAFMGLACEAIIIPDGCTSIGAKAFANCKKLVYLQIPASVKSIAEDAIEGCDSIRIGTMPEQVLVIP